MNFPFFIAHRYLVSRKSTSIINIISGISVVGIAVATMAMVIVLSVFNGFHDLVASLFTNFDPQIEIVPAQGKTAPAGDACLAKVKQLPFVSVATECVEDQALAVFGNHQEVVRVKGVDDNFAQLTHINDILVGDGTFELHAANLEYGIPGIRLAQELGTGSRWQGQLKIYAPRRSGQLDMTDPAAGFVADSLISAGVVFSVRQARYDKNYLLTSIGFARRLFDRRGQISALELRLQNGTSLDEAKTEIAKIVGSKYKVLDRFEQQDETFKIMKIEKFIAYIFLTFILVIACFNIVSSLSMLILDKKNDIQTLHNLGADKKVIARVFLFEGRIIALAGAVAGVLLGLLLCFLQQMFGLVRLGSEEGAFIVDAYPVSVHYSDVLLVFLTVVAVSWITVWCPVHYVSRRLLRNYDA